MDAHEANMVLDVDAATKVMGWMITTRGALDPEEQAKAEQLGSESWAHMWCAQEVYVRPDQQFHEMLVYGEPYTQDGCDNAFHPSCYLRHARMLLDKRAEQGHAWEIEFNPFLGTYTVRVGPASMTGTDEALTITRVATWMNELLPYVPNRPLDVENELG